MRNQELNSENLTGMIEKIKKIIEIVREVDRKLGLKKLVLYTLYVSIVLGLLNWKTVLTNIEDTMNRHKAREHNELLDRREKINTEISGVLLELRISLNADRVILMEYHNTVSNLVGIPFRFMTMTQMRLGYGIEAPDHNKYTSINTGLISEFIQDLNHNDYIEVKDMESFNLVYPIMAKILTGDDCRYAAFTNLSGSRTPVGFIIVEWVREEDHENINWNTVRSELSKSSKDINRIIFDK